MKRICITGAGGMIGTALTEYALSQNTAVLALTRPGGRPMRIAHPMLTVAECDLADLETFASDLACDGFVHLAWASTYGDARNDVRTQLRNIEYTLSAVGRTRPLFRARDTASPSSRRDSSRGFCARRTACATAMRGY